MDDPTNTGKDASPPTDKLGELDLSDEATLAGCVEAILLTTDKPMGAQAIAQALALDADTKPKARVEAAVESLNATYAETGRAFRINAIAGGYRVMTEPTYAPALLAMHGARQSSRLSKPALETLAIVAYRQPVTRAQVESIRGVSCGEVIKSLLERRLLDIVGRAEELGRPMLYGTSKHFLEVFGLASIKDLPVVGDIPDLPNATLAEPKPEQTSDENQEPDDASGDEQHSEGEDETSEATVAQEQTNRS
jgi:segregation and condensation protein B